MDVISLKLDEGMLKDLDKFVKDYNYGTRTEFIRTSIREKMSKLEKDAIIKELLKFKGISKKHTTDEELRRVREKVAEQYFKDRGL